MNRALRHIGRRQFVGAGGLAIGGVLAGTRHAAPTFAQSDSAYQSGLPWEMGSTDIAAGYAAGTFTIPEFIQASLDRINTLNNDGPMINAIIEVNDEAIALAEALQRELDAGETRGPLHGVPVVIKDTIATADRMQTTAGSLAMVGTRATRDAFLVDRMRRAGMIILGKTNLTEWSAYRGSPSGWSSRGGMTVNPYATSQSAWGSSTGSAAAVAASMAPLAIGVETDGSLIAPASACGVVALKPTVGLVSRSGLIPNAYSMDSPGPIARSVLDAAALLNVISGFDSEDIAFGEHAEWFPAASFQESPVPAAGTRDYVSAAQVPDALKGARIGVCRTLFGYEPWCDELIESALAKMADAGAEIVDDVVIESVWDLAGREQEGHIIVYEFGNGFPRWVNDYAPDGPMQSVGDVINFYAEHPDETMYAYDEEPLAWAMYPVDEFGEDHAANLRIMHDLARTNGIDAAMKTYELDAIVSPTAAIPTEPGNESFFWQTGQVAALAGYPSITIPVGYLEDLPAGMLFFGRAFSERKLIRFAYATEQLLQARRPPQFATWSDYDAVYLGGGE